MGGSGRKPCQPGLGSPPGPGFSSSLTSEQLGTPRGCDRPAWCFTASVGVTIPGCRPHSTTSFGHPCDTKSFKYQVFDDCRCSPRRAAGSVVRKPTGRLPSVGIETDLIAKSVVTWLGARWISSFSIHRGPGKPFKSVRVPTGAQTDKQLKSLILAQRERWRHG